MRAGFGALLEHHHRHLGPACGRELLEVDRRRQTRRAAAYDDDVVLHGFSWAEPGGYFFAMHGLYFVGRRLQTAGF